MAQPGPGARGSFELVRKSLVAEGRRSASASVAANVARIVSEGMPIKVNDVERLARVLGVTATELFTG